MVVDVDVELTSPSWHHNWNTDFLTLDMHGVQWAMEMYRNGVPLNHPAVSPVHCSLQGFPPMLIQAGDSEVVTDDAKRLARHAMEQQVPCELSIYQDMFHVFQTFVHIPQANKAFEEIGQFVQGILSEGGSDSAVSLS